MKFTLFYRGQRQRGMEMKTAEVGKSYATVTLRRPRQRCDSEKSWTLDESLSRAQEDLQTREIWFGQKLTLDLLCLGSARLLLGSSSLRHPRSILRSYKDDLRHAERRLVFNIDELSRLAGEAVNRGPDEMVRLEKLAQLRCAVAAFHHDYRTRIA
ncbi:hypothetical protein CPB85DRAFT_1255450 [Mucidula mucida]|nr:hypothetical protein CPB85DRAFT_1255450 [Mucidula mucida]